MSLPPITLITPDDVQGAYPTLRHAVLHDAWPTLGQARGKVLFALDEDPDKVAVYRGKRRSLEGRVFFVNTDEANDSAGNPFAFLSQFIFGTRHGQTIVIGIGSINDVKAFP